jgi:hypothetical protein
MDVFFASVTNVWILISRCENETHSELEQIVLLDFIHRQITNEKKHLVI